MSGFIAQLSDLMRPFFHNGWKDSFCGQIVDLLLEVVALGLLISKYEIAAAMI
jgi:hypothetical protein